MHLLVAIEKHLKGFCHDLVHVNELLVQLVNVLSRIHILKLFLLSDDDSLCNRRIALVLGLCHAFEKGAELLTYQT